MRKMLFRFIHPTWSPPSDGNPPTSARLPAAKAEPWFILTARVSFQQCPKSGSSTRRFSASTGGWRFTMELFARSLGLSSFGTGKIDWGLAWPSLPGLHSRPVSRTHIWDGCSARGGADDLCVKLVSGLGAGRVEGRKINSAVWTWRPFCTWWHVGHSLGVDITGISLAGAGACKPSPNAHIRPPRPSVAEACRHFQLTPAPGALSTGEFTSLP